MDKLIKEIPLTDIIADSEFNCRGEFNSMDVVDLAKDIKLRGLIQPITVTPEQNGRYRLIAGFRRYMAHRVLKLPTIACVTLDKIMTESEARIFNLAENIQRKELNILQEAQALSHLRILGLTEKDVAEQLNVSRGWVQIRYMILELPEEIYPDIMQGNIKQGQISQLHAILRVAGKDACFNTVKEMKDDKIKGLTGKNYKPESKSSKRIRSRTEIFDVLELLFETFKDTPGLALATRSLSWASGEITTGELHMTLKEIANQNGLIYNIPSELQ